MVLDDLDTAIRKAMYFRETGGKTAEWRKLVDSDLTASTNAFGINGASTAVLENTEWPHVVGPSIMTKHSCGTGWISQLATVSALIAEKSFADDKRIIDVAHGYCQMVSSPYLKVDKLFGWLRQVWHITGATSEACPARSVYYTAVEGICNLVNDDEMRQIDIEHIVA